jgi:hypothetical protein
LYSCCRHAECSAVSQLKLNNRPAGRKMVTAADLVAAFRPPQPTESANQNFAAALPHMFRRTGIGQNCSYWSHLAIYAITGHFDRRHDSAKWPANRRKMGHVYITCAIVLRETGCIRVTGGPKQHARRLPLMPTDQIGTSSLHMELHPVHSLAQAEIEWP